MSLSSVEVPANHNVNYYELIRGWAKARNIIGEGGSTPIDQFVKGLSEAGEAWGNIAKGNEKSLAILKDDIGDILVCLINAAGVAGIDIEKHINMPDTIHNKGYWAWYDRIGQKRVSLKILYALASMAALLEEADDLVQEEGCREEDFLNIDVVQFGESFSDLLYTLSGIAHKNGWTIQDCLEEAWNDIRDRKGVMREGTFIKESDITQDIITAALADPKTSPQVVEYLSGLTVA